MKKFLILVLTMVLALAFVACKGDDGKQPKDQSSSKVSSEESSSAESASSEEAKKEDGKDDKKDAKDDKKDEPKSVKADSVDNLFVLIDQAIKSGKIKKVEALYDKQSQAKLDNARKLMGTIAAGLHAQINYEVKNHGKHKGKTQVVKKAGNTVDVKWPSGKVTTKIAVKKVNGEYRIDLLKSPGADLLSM